VAVNQVTDAACWRTAASLAGTWADYRVRVGEYFFRASRPTPPPSPAADTLALALGEFDAALSLDATRARAREYRGWLLNKQNVLGLPRDHDLLPDFAALEGVYTRYYPQPSDERAIA
jgi:hypothetical protein